MNGLRNGNFFRNVCAPRFDTSRTINMTQSGSTLSMCAEIGIYKDTLLSDLARIDPANFTNGHFLELGSYVSAGKGALEIGFSCFVYSLWIWCGLFTH